MFHGAAQEWVLCARPLQRRLVPGIAKPRSTDVFSGLSVFKQVSALIGTVGDCTW
jgi:hypothetical protein